MAAGGSHLSCPLPVSMCEFGGLLPAEATRDGAGIFYPYDRSIPRANFHDGAAGTRRACRLAAGAPKSGHAPSSALVS